jgi:hypothetical protein
MSTVSAVAYSFGAFVNPMLGEFHASRAAVSAVFSVTAFIYFLLGSVTGLLADRVGPRPAVVAGALLTGAGLALTSRIHDISSYLTYAVGGIAAADPGAAFIFSSQGWGVGGLARVYREANPRNLPYALDVFIGRTPVAQERAQLGLTLQNYCSRGKGDLVRGDDFIVQRISPYRRRFNDHGARPVATKSAGVSSFRRGAGTIATIHLKWEGEASDDQRFSPRAPDAVEAGRCRRLS